MNTARLSKGEIEIDVRAILYHIIRNIVLVGLSAVAVGMAVYILLGTVSVPVYQSTTKIFVLNRQSSEYGAVTYTDLQTSSQVIKDYMQIVTTRPVVEKTIQNLGLDYLSYDDFCEKVSVSSVNDTRIITIAVYDTNPRLARDIANCLRKNAIEEIKSVMVVEGVNVVEPANYPVESIDNNNKLYTLAAAVMAAMVVCVILALQVISDNRIKTAEELKKYFDCSILGTIPEKENTKEKTH